MTDRQRAFVQLLALPAIDTYRRSHVVTQEGAQGRREDIWKPLVSVFEVGRAVQREEDQAA